MGVRCRTESTLHTEKPSSFDARDLLAHHPVPQWVHVAPSGPIVAISGAALSALGRTRGEVVGATPADLFAPEERARVLDGALAAGGRFLLRHPTEGVRPAHVRSVVVDWEGTPAVLVTFQQASDLDQLEDALHASRTSFRQMAENVPGALFRYTQRPDGTSAVQYMSPRCFDLWEIPPHLIEHDASLLWNTTLPEDRPALEASVRESAATLKPWSQEWRLVTPSGKVKWVQGMGRPEPGPSGTVLWNSLIIDVTDRRLADLERERLRDEVQRASRLEALGRMAGGIAHDFNNLVTVILGHADMALAALPDGAPARGDVASLLTAAERAAALTSQLLAFSNRQATTAPVIDLAAHLRSTAPLLARLAGPLIDLQVATPDTTVRVRLDPTRADQILTNLVANARDASAPNQRVRVTLEVRGARAALVVSDRGVGMTEATLARLFEPFFTTRPAGRGTGLGLPTVQAIVQQAGGEILIESDLGRGSTFQILLPLTESPVDAPVDDRPNAPLAGARIVVVDDEDPIRQMVARALGRAGAQVQVADGVRAAQRLVAEQRPHLLLTDIAMPDGTGWDLASSVRHAQPSVAIVFMTSYISDPAIRRAIQESGEPLLLKPFTIDALLDEVARALPPRTLPP